MIIVVLKAKNVNNNILRPTYIYEYQLQNNSI